MKQLFFSQSMLDSMTDAGKIKVDGNVLTMLAGDNPTFTLVPAYRFVKTANDAPDTPGLVGQIKSEQEIKALGAEIYMDSVICREVAYQADPGFIAVQREAGQTAEQQPAEPKAEEKPKDEDQLSKFILDNLL